MGPKHAVAAIKYPNIKVKLVGQDGNAFFVIGKVRRALVVGKISDTEASTFVSEAFKCPSYDDLLRLCMKWVSVS